MKLLFGICIHQLMIKVMTQRMFLGGIRAGI